MANIRRDVAKLGPGWNDTILYYAKAVAELRKKRLAERTGWLYLAAIHGFEQNLWVGSGTISPGEPSPANAEIRQVWNQCEHWNWYFLPWHRGYLAAFEAIFAKTIAEIGGPADWALPYWNYFDDSGPESRDLPWAFRQAVLPDGTPNPLADAVRHGTGRLGPFDNIPDITLNCMTKTQFTSASGDLAFGGLRPTLDPNDREIGAVEKDPHNWVHVMVGGLSPPGGFMSDPALAGLDPVFWLHHCNIDRLWSAWLSRSGNIQENSAQWLNGPLPEEYWMPDISGSLEKFTPADTLPGARLEPTYDDLTIGTAAPAQIAGAEALGGASGMPATLSDALPPPTELLGSNTEVISVGSARRKSVVAIAAAPAAIAASPTPKKFYIGIHNVRGPAASSALRIAVGSAQVDGGEPVNVETVALFGLRQASDPENRHAGNGISFAVDITPLARRIIAETGTLEAIEVYVEQVGGALGELTIGRIAVVSKSSE